MGRRCANFEHSKKPEKREDVHSWEIVGEKFSMKGLQKEGRLCTARAVLTGSTKQDTRIRRVETAVAHNSEGFDQRIICSPP